MTARKMTEQAAPAKTIFGPFRAEESTAAYPELRPSRKAKPDLLGGE